MAFVLIFTAVIAFACIFAASTASVSIATAVTAFACIFADSIETGLIF